MNSPFPPGSLVANYSRDSGGDSQELSVLQQTGAFQRFCQENGLIPGAMFQDVARPGSSAIGRDGFNAMMSHFRHDASEAGLVIWSYSRFSRDFNDSAFYRADLRRRGYLLHSLTDDIPEGSIGKLFEAIIDWKNENFRIDLSRDIQRGLRDLVVRYGAVPGTPPRGFARKQITVGARRDGQPHIVHKWEPDPALIPAVRQAFTMLLAGNSLDDIRLATGLYTSINSFKTFFANPLYTGRLIYGDLVVDHYCDPIIDAPTWEAAQMIINARAHRQHLKGDNPHHPRRSRAVYLLSGLAYCARCGSPLSGSTSAGGSRIRHERYICSRRSRRRDCDAPLIPRIYLEDLVVQAIREHILTPANILANQDLVQSTQVERQADLDRRRADLRARLAAARRRIRNITDTLAEQGKSRALLDKLAALEMDEADLLSQLSAIDHETQTTPTPQTPEEIAAHLDRLLASPDLARLLSGLVQRIIVDRDGDVIRLQIDYYYPPSDTVPMTSPPLGAPPHRHVFTWSTVTRWQRKPYTRR